MQLWDIQLFKWQKHLAFFTFIFMLPYKGMGSDTEKNTNSDSSIYTTQSQAITVLHSILNHSKGPVLTRAVVFGIAYIIGGSLYIKEKRRWGLESLNYLVR
jgi:hypothetical protein